MTKRMLLLNIMLLLGCVLIGKRVYQEYSDYYDTHKVEAVEPESGEKKASGSKAPTVSSPAAVNPAENMIISEKNLFLESRSMQAANATPVVEQAPQLNPKPLLMGVAMVGSEPRAFIQSLRAQPGQRPTRILRMGEVYEGYKVSQIQRTRVELSYTSPTGNVTTQVLDINDAANKAARSATRTPLAPSQVISVGAPMGTPGQAQLPPGQSVDEQGRRVIRTPFGDVVAPPGVQNAPTRQLATNPNNQNQMLLQQEQQIQQQLQQPRPQTGTRSRNEVIDEQGRRVIRTPFGDIVRPAETPPPTSPPTTIPPSQN